MRTFDLDQPMQGVTFNGQPVTKRQAIDLTADQSDNPWRCRYCEEKVYYCRCDGTPALCDD